MKTFKRKRTLEELQAECKKRGWELETAKYDQGSDFVSFKFIVGKTSGVALINTFNGRLIGEANGMPFSDDNAKLDGKKWFKELLNTAYAS